MEVVLYFVFGLVLSVAGAFFVSFLLFAPQKSKLVHGASVLTGSLLTMGALAIVLEERTGAMPPTHVMVAIAIMLTVVLFTTVRKLNY